MAFGITDLIEQTKEQAGVTALVPNPVNVLTELIKVLKDFDRMDQARILRAAATYYDVVSEVAG